MLRITIPVRYFFPDYLVPKLTQPSYLAQWLNDLVDAPKTLQAFFDGCSAAGPAGCAFYAPTPEAISQNLTKLYDSVRAKPVPVASMGVYGFVDYARLRGAVFSSLNAPYQLFPILAAGLANLAAGDGTLIFALTTAPAFECSCGEGEDDVYPDADTYVRTTISCNDGTPVPNSVEEFQKYYERLSAVTEFADIWAGLRAECM